ncbi:MAG: ribosome maturation factor RimM [Chloroflexi bacterium]|nr:ribosome maturation factor RimM [Chloroflexota bacterium]MCL5076073.1 ribosome maturation factor RimM [Chloroflexota bacterium]
MSQARREPPPAGKTAAVTHLIIGRIIAPWGLKGEIKVEILTDFPDRFFNLTVVYVGEKQQPYHVEGVGRHKSFIILKLRGCDTREMAEKLRGQLLQVPLDQAVKLPEGHYYWYQIGGLEVWTTDGEFLGLVSEVTRTGSNDIYVVKGRRGTILLPAIEDVVKSIDLAGRRILVERMPGLF